jgi:hypothetical protein
MMRNRSEDVERGSVGRINAHAQDGGEFTIYVLHRRNAR